LYASLEVGRYGKKKEGRIVGVTDFTIQYYRAYLQQQYSDPTNKEAFLFLNHENSAMSRNIPVGNDGLRADYRKFRDVTIPKLLKRPDIPKEDKERRVFLRDQKRWNPYILRHSSISKLARNPNINDYVLRQHAGWTKHSDMVEIYTRSQRRFI
jgi:hypothetical protein